MYYKVKTGSDVLRGFFLSNLMVFLCSVHCRHCNKKLVIVACGIPDQSLPKCSLMYVIIESE